MRLSKYTSRSLVAATVAGMALLAGCGGPDKPVGTVGHVKGFAGVVAADEPNAALAARDTLSAGGSVADAAVALYFTLAVTLPSTATLGAGGSCVIHDKTSKTTEVLDFPASVSSGRMPVGLPMAARGFYALHAKYGKLQWEGLLQRGEKLARFGLPLPRALALDLARGASLLSQDPLSRRVFFRRDGRVVAEGDTIEQLDLAAVLTRMKRNLGDFYTGQQARDLTAAARGLGATVAIEDFLSALPQFRPTATVKVGQNMVHFPSTPAQGGEPAKVMVELQALSAEDLAKVPATAVAKPSDGPRPPAPGTAFAIIDADGSAVACGLSANGLFGAGRMVPGTGLFIAAPPAPGGSPVVPVVVVNPNVNEVRLAGAAAGGVDPARVMAAAVLAATAGERPLEEVVAMQYAAGADAKAGPGNARVAAVACTSGSPSIGRCRAAADPRGHGYAVVVGKD